MCAAALSHKYIDEIRNGAITSAAGGCFLLLCCFCSVCLLSLACWPLVCARAFCTRCHSCSVCYGVNGIFAVDNGPVGRRIERRSLASTVPSLKFRSQKPHENKCRKKVTLSQVLAMNHNETLMPAPSNSRKSPENAPKFLCENTHTRRTSDVAHTPSSLSRNLGQTAQQSSLASTFNGVPLCCGSCTIVEANELRL